MHSTKRLPRALVPAVLALLLTCCSRASSGDPLSKTELNLLGTVCTITVYGGKPSDLEDAFARIRDIDDRMTVSRGDSEVIRVNTAAGIRSVTVSADTYSVIKQGIAFSVLGNGVFDITVGPLVKLWGIGTEGARVPAAAEIRDALSRLDYRAVHLKDAGPEVFLAKPGMGLDLGAIAKGYAADEAARLLKARGVPAALINLGGNIVAGGRKPDGSPWRIGIQDPEKPRGDSIGYIETAPVSVVTSGIYERYFVSDGIRYHHLFDTRTGYPVQNGLLSVTIVTGSSMIADGYSTLAFALGPEKGRAILEHSPDDVGAVVGAVFITENRDVYVTPGLRSVFHLTDKAFSLKGW
jgi:thiamine biosynthesis lipoprotein